MSKRDYYDILGVARGADGDALKSAFRRRAKDLHPDRNPGDAAAEARFKELNEAYEVLKDPQKRAAYDRFGHAAFDGGMGGAGPRGGFDFAASFTDVFDDLFGEFMGGRRGGGTRAHRGADLRYNLEITLEDAFAGKAAEIRVPSLAVCEVCEGTGAEPGSRPETCPTCNGSGKVRASQGFFTIERTCPTCRGAGRIIKNPCKACNGHGRVQREKTLKVTIPPGVEEGTRIRLSGEGEPGAHGGPAGDLYIFLSIASHPLFLRDGLDLLARVPVSMTTAALGGAIDVPALSGGQARVQISEGAQSGQRFRLKGRGMPAMRGGATGDLFVEIVVEVPVNLSKKQKELLREFDKAGTAANHPETAGFFARVRDFFEGRS